MPLSPPRIRIVPSDREALERRARALASAGAGPEADPARRGETLYVTFKLAGMRCAVAATVVARALHRLGRAVPVPRAEGGERLVAFVDERPVAVADLAACAGAAARDSLALGDAPALAIATGDGEVALAVESPLDLAEERAAELSGAATPADPLAPRLVGQLSDGTSVLDPTWLLRIAATEGAR